MANQLFTGYLYDDTGAAVANATVNLYDRNTTTPVRATTTTDATGLWTISHATEGRFDVEIVSGTSKRRRKYDDQIQVDTIEVANLNIRNPADTFDYSILPAAITADRTLTLPLITGTDTLAVLGLAQTFSATQTFAAIVATGLTITSEVIQTAGVLTFQKAYSIDTTAGALTLNPTSGVIISGNGSLVLSGAFEVSFGASDSSITATSAGVARSLAYNLKITAGGAANAVVQMPFQLDTVTEAGLLGETDGAGSYTQAKTVWKVPYRDAGAGAVGPTAPTTGATWNGGLTVQCSDAVANGRLYWYANEAAHYVDATAGFSFLYKEPTTFGDFNNWSFGDLMVLKVDRYNEDGGHALPYPMGKALKESFLYMLDTDMEFREQVKEKLHA